MKILVDADAFPNALKDILFRAAERVRVPVVMVANKHVGIPRSEFVSKLVVGSGFDEADKRVAELTEKGDLVITADIPLADRVISLGASAFSPRGELFTPANIKHRMATRELLSELRVTGEVTGGPPPIGQKDRQKFADQLNSLLAKLHP